MGFSRPQYWSGLPRPPPGDLPNPGIEPRSPTLQTDSLPSEYVWNLKHHTNELIYEAKTDSQTLRTDLWLPRGRAGWGRDRLRRLGLAGASYHLYTHTHTHTYTHIEYINNKVLLYSTRNYIQYPVINHNEKEFFKKLVSSRKNLYEKQKSRQRWIFKASLKCSE